ncbi:dynein light chain type 1-domain-containing protein [Globomyces pollinis-pini]|nr:dynein light chain type 1-domain-containing protein [Globomyces pollinis-pini]KAJ2991181.1 Dynein light chain 4, axonemal [Globomyces sp. JEL0801]
MADSGSVSNLAAIGKEGGGVAEKTEDKDTRRAFNYALIKFCDMTDEMRAEAVDMVVTAVEKHISNYEAASKAIKESMDKRAGSSWHVIVGEGFGFEITHEMRNLLYMYFGGNLGVLVWKAS